MKTAMVFIAGAMFLSTAFANDPGFEERYKMKTGRYTPAEDARREAVKAAAKESRAKQMINCGKHGCCTGDERAVAKSEPPVGDPGAEARLRMKFGRSSPAEEARISAAKRANTEPVLAASASMCESDCCKHRL